MAKGSSISVWESTELQGVLLAMRGMDKELSAQIRKATRTVTEAEWRGDLAKHASTDLERTVLVRSARVSVSNQNVTLKSGTLASKLSGGAKTFELTPSVEWGSATGRTITSKSKKGKTYTRRQGSTFKPRKRQGYVAYPAAADAIPRLAALWVATVVRTFYEAVEKGTR